MRLLYFTALLFTAMLVSTAAAVAGNDFKNAVYNNDMSFGLSSWKLIAGKNDNAGLKIIGKDIIDVRKNILSFGKEGDVKWWLYNNLPVKVKPGQKYRISLTASGQGKTQIGVFEYNPGFLRNKVSGLLELGEDVKTFHYDYIASKDVTEIRPAMLFQSLSGKLEANVYNVSFDIPADDFASATSWPQKTNYVKSTDQKLQEQIDKFKDYKGITASERSKILNETEVKGVLPPFKSIEQTGRTSYKLTLSEIDFGGSAFPKSVKIKGREVLAQPIELKMNVAGLEAPEALPAQHMFSPEKVIVTQELKYGKCRVTVQCELSYDALMLYKVSIQPMAGATISLSQLELSIKKDIAKYFRFNAIRFKEQQNFYFMTGFGPIPAPGEAFKGKYKVLNGRWRNEWQPLESSASNVALWNCKDFMPTFWLGDEDLGLGFVCESKQGWNNKPEADIFELDRSTDYIAAKMTFISVPAEMTHGREITFALQAMPPKNPPSNWFKASLDHEHQFRLKDNYKKAGRPLVAKQQGIKNNLVSVWYTFWAKGCGTPEVAKPEELADFIKGCQYYNYEPLIYLTPTHLSLLTKEGVFYGPLTKKWSVFPEKYYFVPKQELVKLCPASFMSEFQAYEIGKLIDKYGIRGIYFDNANPRPCFSLKHGCGHENDKGQVDFRVPILSVRKFFMMVRNQFIKRGITPQIVIHAGFFPGEISFADYEVNGEGVYSLDYSDVLSMAEIRAQMIGPNQYGCGFIMLPQFSYLKEKKPRLVQLRPEHCWH